MSSCGLLGTRKKNWSKPSTEPAQWLGTGSTRVPGDAERAILIQSYEEEARGRLYCCLQAPGGQAERKQRSFSWTSAVRGHRHLPREPKCQLEKSQNRFSTTRAVGHWNQCPERLWGGFHPRDTQAQLPAVPTKPSHPRFAQWVGPDDPRPESPCDSVMHCRLPPAAWRFHLMQPPFTLLSKNANAYWQTPSTSGSQPRIGTTSISNCRKTLTPSLLRGSPSPRRESGATGGCRPPGTTPGAAPRPGATLTAPPRLQRGSPTTPPPHARTRRSGFSEATGRPRRRPAAALYFSRDSAARPRSPSRGSRLGREGRPGSPPRAAAAPLSTAVPGWDYPPSALPQPRAARTPRHHRRPAQPLRGACAPVEDAGVGGGAQHPADERHPRQQLDVLQPDPLAAAARQHQGGQVGARAPRARLHAALPSYTPRPPRPALLRALPRALPRPERACWEV